jgi:hypothetical protein
MIKCHINFFLKKLICIHIIRTDHINIFLEIKKNWSYEFNESYKKKTKMNNTYNMHTYWVL